MKKILGVAGLTLLVSMVFAHEFWLQPSRFFAQPGETDKPSRELYQRCVKTLVQAGAMPTGTFAKNTGMPLEIIPVANPYAQHPGQLATFRILFVNKPLPGALVRHWNRSVTNAAGKNPDHEQKQRSNAQGQVQFRLRAGSNMVSVVRMVAAEKTAQADGKPVDWHSYWGSLTFGCR